MTHNKSKLNKLDKIRKKVEESPKEHPDFGRVCHCSCHIDDIRVFCSCFIPCCRREQKKYFNADGEFDIKRFGEIIMHERLRDKGKE